MHSKDVTGRWGEDTAAGYLVATGLEILDRNWRCAAGELDIVARDGDEVVFCEVKTRTGTAFGDPAEAVTWRKSRRLRTLAARWLEAHPGNGAPGVRFDVVAVLRPRSGEATVRHVREAF